MLYAVLALVLLAGSGAAVLYFVVFAPVSTVGKVDFDRPLKVPPLADSHVDPDGTRVFHLTAKDGSTELLPGTRSPTWGFNGTYLGPTLRAERGEKVRVEVTNQLGETTTVHWHGMHIPARFDGGPHQPIKPGHTWRPTWRIDQPAATLWYHPHPHGRTQDHINRGLAGMFLIDDPSSRVADRLPHHYGVDDVPVIVQDKQVQFQVLSVDGKKPAPVLSGWKDTVFMPPGRTVRLAMRFTDYTDPNSPYMFHCHLLPHEDHGMMGQFVVVRPGSRRSLRATLTTR